MTTKAFRKILSANDVGNTGGHQAGILIPRSEAELLSLLPVLDPAIKNPDAWIECEDESGVRRKFRFVYYNNKLHDEGGTRNEYRLTHITKYFQEHGADEGEALGISKNDASETYRIRIVREALPARDDDVSDVFRIKIKSTWRRVH